MRKWTQGQIDAQRYLQRYEHADRRAKSLEREYKQEEELIDAVRSTADVDGLPKSKGIKKETEERAIRLADKAAEMKIATLDALHERQEVAEIIFAVKDDDDAREVLAERYINYNQTWEEICVKINFSWNRAHRAHRRGLTAIHKIIETQDMA